MAHADLDSVHLTYYDIMFEHFSPTACLIVEVLRELHGSSISIARFSVVLERDTWTRFQMRKTTIEARRI